MTTIKKTFLLAGQREPAVKYQTTYFQFKDKIQTWCKEQSLEQIISNNNSLEIFGIISSNDCETNDTLESPKYLNFKSALSDKNLSQNYLTYASNKAKHLHYQNDPNTYDLKYHFMLGADVLSPSALQENPNEVKSFSEKKWEHRPTEQIYNGKEFICISFGNTI